MKPLPTRKVLAALRSAGCKELRNNGRHTVFGCPCGRHIAPVPVSHRTVKAGVLRSITRQLSCLSEGWLP